METETHDRDDGADRRPGSSPGPSITLHRMNILAAIAAVPLQEALPDTVVTVQSWNALHIVQLVTLIMVAVTMLALFAVLFFLARELRRVQGAVAHLVERVEDRVDPVFERARSVAQNVDYMSHAIRNDVEGLADSVDGIRQRLDQASERMEERIEEFNALMEVVQDEAEEIFLDTASTVRGVREGSRSLRRTGDGRGDAPDSPSDPDRER